MACDFSVSEQDEYWTSGLNHTIIGYKAIVGTRWIATDPCIETVIIKVCRLYATGSPIMVGVLNDIDGSPDLAGGILMEAQVVDGMHSDPGYYIRETKVDWTLTAGNAYWLCIYSESYTPDLPAEEDVEYIQIQMDNYAGTPSAHPAFIQYSDWAISIYPNASVWFSIFVGENCSGTFDIVFVDSVNGDNTHCGGVNSRPKKTFGATYSVLNSGGLIRILNNGADFSGESVTFNKSFLIDLNGNAGSFYLPQGI